MSTPTSDLSNITVAILAGGLGTRLAPVVPGRQKVVAKVGKHSFLKYILSQLNQSSFKKVVICTGHLGHQVQEEFGNTYQSLSLCYSQEKSRLGTAGAVRFALPLLKSQVILVMNGDTFCDVNFNKFWRFHQDKTSNASLILSAVSNASRFGTAQIDKDNAIVKFEEKKSGNRSGLVNAGIYLINKSLISKISEGKEISLEKEVFPKWIGKEFYGFKVDNEFIDIGTPESYKSAQKFFAKFKL